MNFKSESTDPKSRFNSRSLAALLLAAGLGFSAHAQAFDTDLVICLDSTGSLSDAEWQLQLDGTAMGLQAVLSPDFLTSMVRITVIQFWSTTNVRIPPTVIDSQATLDTLTGDIDTPPGTSGTRDNTDGIFEKLSGGGYQYCELY
jgi:hypothetical protein